MEYSKEFQELKTRLTYDAKNEMWVDLTVDEIKTILSETHNLMEEIDRLTAANKWVSVSERLPIENKPVLVSVKGYVYPKIGWHCHNIEIPQWSTADDLYFHDISYSEVTHWQPLPTPPTGGE